MNTTKKRIYIVVGTRPNFIKVTQFKRRAIKYPNLSISIIHTGQHYDAQMVDVFFNQLQIEPDYYLNIGQGTPNTQVAQIMLRLEELFNTNGMPDLLMVVGDVNSTLAAAIAAHKMNVPLAHIESGLRSLDRSMPEEINRIITDELTDYYFVTEQSGYDNLIKEAKDPKRVFFVGNTMIDTLVAFQDAIHANPVLNDLGVEDDNFVLMTMHRPATVDNKEGLSKLMDVIEEITRYWRLIFPIHPRTLKNLELYCFSKRFLGNAGIIHIPPLDYFAFQKLIARCKYVITDSGGIQEETTYVGKPCLTLRPNTERPVTCETGTNTLVPFDLQVLASWFDQIRKGNYKKGAVPPLWDGHATERILNIITEKL